MNCIFDGGGGSKEGGAIVNGTEEKEEAAPRTDARAAKRPLQEAKAEKEGSGCCGSNHLF